MTSSNGKTESQRELLYRIDERTTRQAKDLAEIKEILMSQYVTKTEFEPIKKIVYGVVGLVLTAVLTALITLVVLG